MGKQGERASASRDPARAELVAALGRVRTALVQRGLLLLQDAELPAATTLIVGQVVRGSWWAHPQNKLVYDALQELDADVLRVKLVRDKVTLVARPLWPALLSTARSRERWQLEGLSAAGRRLLELVDAAPAPVRLDQVRLPAADDAPRAFARELERRLLVHADELHTGATSRCWNPGRSGSASTAPTSCRGPRKRALRSRLRCRIGPNLGCPGRREPRCDALAKRF